MQSTNQTLIPITQKLCEQADATPQDCTPVQVDPVVCDDDGLNFCEVAVLIAFACCIVLFYWAIYAIGGIPALVCMILFPLFSGAFASTSRRPRPSSGGESQGRSVGTISRR